MIQPPTNTEGLIETQSGPISIRELSYFLYHFRAAYVEGIKLNKREFSYEALNDEDLEKIAEEVAIQLASKGTYGISQSALADLPANEELNFIDLTRRNPIEIVFSCVAVALAAAVIISGGEIKWDKDGFSVKLPPLGKGIAELKKAIKGEYQPRISRKQDDEDDSFPSP